MTDFGTARRRLLRAVGVASLGVLSSSGAAGQEVPQPSEVAEANDALDWIEEQVESMVNRPTNSYIIGGSPNPQLAFDTAHTDPGALENYIYKSAMFWARAIENGAPLRVLQFRVYHAKLGETYEYAASYKFNREKAVQYTEGTIGREEYIDWAQSRLRWRDGR